ncbi:MAG: type III pantothenate kinase [Pirellulaceae bacterium]
MNAPVVAVGIGNTTIKMGVALRDASGGQPQWLARAEFPTAEFEPAQATRLLGDGPCPWLVATVHRQAEQRLADWVRTHRGGDHYIRLSHRDMPIELDVEVPERVGLDRLAAAVASNFLREPNRPAVVVDAGTAITVNLITPDGVFRGGVILPGFKLTARALAEGTDQLPLIAADVTGTPPPVIGRSTEAAIRSGLFWGNVGAVRELVTRVARELPRAPQIFVTGGDAQRLAGCIAPDAQFVPDLVLLGVLLSRPARLG